MLHISYSSDKAVQELSRLLMTKRASHAFILFGSRGIGKSTLVRALTRSLLNNVGSNYHSNLLWIDAEQKKSSVENIRNIHDFIQKTSYRTLPKIVVIDSVDNLNVFGTNALLKILEEPAQQSLFILISSNITLISQTIRSRCVNIRFSPANVDSTISIIKSKYPNLNKEYIEKYVYLSRDMPGVACDLIDNEGLLFYEQLLHIIDQINYKADLLYDFIDSNFFKSFDPIKWKTFKVLIFHFLKKVVLAKSINVIERASLIKKELDVVMKIYPNKSTDEWLSLDAEINKLIHHTEFSNLSIPNIFLLIFYKIGYIYD